MLSGVPASLVQTIPPPARPQADRADVPVKDIPVKAIPGKAVAAKAVAVLPKKTSTPGQLTDTQKAQVDKLRKIDREVKAHEQAHKNVGGRYAGSASFSYVVGPDGKRYAVGGEVPIDSSPVKNNPAATIAKMTIVAAAALAPAKPSGQDRRVAAQASALGAEARAELAQKSQAKLFGQQGKDARPESFGITNSGTTNSGVTDSQAGKSGHSLAAATVALTAYNAGTSTANNNGISGNILNIIG